MLEYRSVGATRLLIVDFKLSFWFAIYLFQSEIRNYPYNAKSTTETENPSEGWKSERQICIIISQFEMSSPYSLPAGF